ncbi:hypothetical protein CEXT_2421 [Caerostris extrusa]|uniref:Uncharacterized protein n=1 Tax=Caerostris extrusa TaxID=172846 RepID=A0AAV4P7H6_CAEEX|nr:hypothetical protein CEXT_2421 [Caerostris extrusa]
MDRVINKNVSSLPVAVFISFALVRFLWCPHAGEMSDASPFCVPHKSGLLFLPTFFFGVFPLGDDMRVNQHDEEMVTFLLATLDVIRKPLMGKALGLTFSIRFFFFSVLFLSPHLFRLLSSVLYGTHTREKCPTLLPSLCAP